MKIMAKVLGTVTEVDPRSTELRREIERHFTEGTETVAMLQAVQEVGSRGTEAMSDGVIRVTPGNEPWLVQNMDDGARERFLQSKERIEASMKELGQRSLEREQGHRVMHDGRGSWNEWPPLNHRARGRRNFIRSPTQRTPMGNEGGATREAYQRET